MRKRWRSYADGPYGWNITLQVNDRIVKVYIDAMELKYSKCKDHIVREIKQLMEVTINHDALYMESRSHA